MARLKKVIFTLMIPLLISLLTTGCSISSKNRWLEENKKVKILCTTAQIGDLAMAIGGDRVDGWVLIRGELDPHSYEIVKGDLEKLDRAQVIFYNGLGLEHGAGLSSYLKQSNKAIAIGEKILQANPERVLWQGKTVDPHIWMDISLWQKGIDPIIDALSAVDPEGRAQYLERGSILKEEMARAHTELKARLQNIPSAKRYLVTSHDAFHYFTRSYLADPGETNWESRFAAPEGLAPEGQLGPYDIQKIIHFLNAKKISVIFPESNVSRDAIRKIAAAGKELGLEVRICTPPLYGDAMGNLSYLQMMHHNGQTIEKYLWNTP